MVVGVDLCGGGWACKVIRVAAADAESLRPTPLMNGLEMARFLCVLFLGGDPLVEL